MGISTVEHAPAQAGWTPLKEAAMRAHAQLRSAEKDWDAVVCAGDMHGIALAAIVATEFNKPLMVVCTHAHDCVVSHIVTIGECSPRHRYLYVDDFFQFGASLKTVMDYMNQSAHAPVVATYEVNTQTYTRLDG